MLDGNPRGDLVIKVTIACGVLETLAVFLRLLARWKSKAAFAADDWWIVATLIPSYAMLAIGCLMVTIGGGGRHAETLNLYQVETFLKTVSAALIAYAITIFMVKISILLMYRRIFDTEAFKTATWVVGTACVAWAIAAVLCLVLQCHPFSGLWNPEDTFTNKCINLQAYYRAVASSNMALDVVILCMPLYMIWRLKLEASQKLMLSGIFALGGLGCVASLMRIITVNLIKGADLPYSLTTPYMWSQLEPTMAVVCACLTTYRPLFAGLHLKFLSTFSRGKRYPSGMNDNDTFIDIIPNSRRSSRWAKSRTPSDNRELLRFERMNNQGTKGGLRVVTHSGVAYTPPASGALSPGREDYGFPRFQAKKEDSFV
ncbi:MAG: hypothetical protein Q9175_004718 [Cornicularia normoerica]